MKEESHKQIQTRVGVRTCKRNLSELKKQLDENSENRLANDKQNHQLEKRRKQYLCLTDDEGSGEEKDEGSEEEKDDSDAKESEAEGSREEKDLEMSKTDSEAEESEAEDSDSEDSESEDSEE